MNKMNDSKPIWIEFSNKVINKDLNVAILNKYR
jgi:hypothetical protein